MAEIYKIHGCCTNPSSIIINQKDYEVFNEKNAYLIAKLLTIFMEHPIVFIGYSISDSNIIDILTNISRCLSSEKLLKLKDRFIFVQWNNNGEEQTVTHYELSVGKGKSIIMTKITVENYSCIYEALLENKVSYNPRLIKKLRNDIYKLVVTSKPSETLKVLVDVDDDKLDKLEAVVGFGITTQLGILGYGTFDAEDLFEDLILDKSLDSKLIVTESLPVILKSTRIVPMFKYLNDYCTDLPEIVKKWSNKTTLDNIFTKTINKKRENKSMLINKSISDIRAEEGLEYTIEKIFTFNEKQYNSTDLYSLIKEYMTTYPKCLRGQDEFKKNDLKRLIRLYDYIKYKEKK